MSDYISREAALKSIFNEKWDIIRTSNLNDYMKGRAYGFDQAFSVVENMPSADVAPVVHGRWECELDNKGWNKHTCSLCGYMKRTDIHVSLGWNFCPNCGAKMDAEVEE